MRLINTSTLELEDFTLCEIPPYAILSHTWGDGEVSFQDMSLPDRLSKKGYVKIKRTCGLALKRGIEFAWVDTCCIDKSSSAELTESINSMFQWYRNAVECYVFLEDLPPDTPAEGGLTDCRWFTRGWTLQELIAPENVEFYDRAWRCRGSKHTFLDVISSSTKIPRKLLSGKIDLQDCSIAQRMSWAACRQTTRVEDTSYCLLGIFDVNMPLIYGESTKAFRRLQEEIIKRNNDLTIFAWDVPHGERHNFLNIFATSPKAFIDKPNTQHFAAELADFSVTNKGLLISGNVPIQAVTVKEEDGRKSWRYLAVLGYSQMEPIGIYLRKIGPRLFHRDGKFPLFSLQRREKGRLINLTNYYILIDPRLAGITNFNRFRQAALHVPFNDIFQLRTKIPSTLWDVTDRVFLRPSMDYESPYPMVIAMIFEGTIAGKLVELIVLCDYRKKVPDFKILPSNQYPRHVAIILTNNLKDGYTYWEEFIFQATEILNSSNYTNIKIGHQLFRVSVSYEEKIVKHISMIAEVVSLNLSVEQKVGKKFLAWEASRTQ